MINLAYNYRNTNRPKTICRVHWKIRDQNNSKCPSFTVCFTKNGVLPKWPMETPTQNHGHHRARIKRQWTHFHGQAWENNELLLHTLWLLGIQCSKNKSSRQNHSGEDASWWRNQEHCGLWGDREKREAWEWWVMDSMARAWWVPKGASWVWEDVAGD